MSTESQTLETASRTQTFINRLSEHIGQEVTIKGWLYNLRSSGKILFPQLPMERVWSSASPEEFCLPGNLGRTQGLGQESALAISGTVREAVARRVVLKLTSCTPKFSMKFTLSHHAQRTRKSF